MPEIAPAKASLDTTEPQTIINKSYIQDSVANTGRLHHHSGHRPQHDRHGHQRSRACRTAASRTRCAACRTAISRINYDGIPFGDTNGPTHHSESYFPAVPSAASTSIAAPAMPAIMGPSTYGGSVNMFSEALTPTATPAGRSPMAASTPPNVNANYPDRRFR